MANPQLENGYTRIPNELLEALMQQELPGNLWRVLLCILRKTHGYGKEVDYLANSQIARGSHLSKVIVSRSLKLLTQGNYIVRQSRKHVGIQTNYDLWNSKLAKQPTIKKLANSSTELANQLTKVSYPHVTQKKKETVQKKEEGYTDINKMNNTTTPLGIGEQIIQAERELANPNLLTWQRMQLEKRLKELKKKDPDRFIKDEYSHMIRR